MHKAEMAGAEKDYKLVKMHRDNFQEGYNLLQERIASLEDLLREIEEHPDCVPNVKGEHIYAYDDYYRGVVIGHRCAAAIARKAREK
jgi:hypothetical protein